MKRTMLFLAILGMFFAYGTSAFSAEVTSTLDVSANVPVVCSVSTTPINFDEYDYTILNSAQGSVDVTCSPTLDYQISLDQGQNWQGNFDRAMSDGNGNFLFYGIFKGPSPVESWGDGILPGSTPISDTGNGLLQSHIAYGFLGANQLDVPPGPYSDIVNVSVEY